MHSYNVCATQSVWFRLREGSLENTQICIQIKICCALWQVDGTAAWGSEQIFALPFSLLLVLCTLF
jgi:hypothetical protein